MYEIHIYIIEFVPQGPAAPPALPPRAPLPGGTPEEAEALQDHLHHPATGADGGGVCGDPVPRCGDQVMTV